MSGRIALEKRLDLILDELIRQEFDVFRGTPGYAVSWRIMKPFDSMFFVKLWHASVPPIVQGEGRG